MRLRRQHGDQREHSAPKPVAKNGRDVGFALGIVFILAVLFLPIPAFLIDIGLAFSIALSVLILMVALWIQQPLDFSSFPTVLLIATHAAAVAQHRDDAPDPVAWQRGHARRRPRHRRLSPAS